MTKLIVCVKDDFMNITSCNIEYNLVGNPVVAIKFIQCKDMHNMQGTEGYSPKDIFFCICFEDGTFATYPTSKYNVEFE